MSLEKAIQENTEAIKALTAQLAQGGAPAAQEKAAEAPAKDEKKTSKKAETKSEAPAKEPAADAIPYDDVKNKTLELVKAKGRDAVMALLADFGKSVQSAKDLREDQYADYLARVDALLAEEDVA